MGSPLLFSNYWRFYRRFWKNNARMRIFNTFVICKKCIFLCSRIVRKILDSLFSFHVLWKRSVADTFVDWFWDCYCVLYKILALNIVVFRFLRSSLPLWSSTLKPFAAFSITILFPLATIIYFRHFHTYAFHTLRVSSLPTNSSRCTTKFHCYVHCPANVAFAS